MQQYSRASGIPTRPSQYIPVSSMPTVYDYTSLFPKAQPRKRAGPDLFPDGLFKVAAVDAAITLRPL
eukprot:5394323-Pyramimonas_sp.AAC.1